MKKIFLAKCLAVEAKERPGFEQWKDVLRHRVEFLLNSSNTKLVSEDEGLAVYYGDLRLGYVELLEEREKLWKNDEICKNAWKEHTWVEDGFNQYPYATEEELKTLAEAGSVHIDIVGALEFIQLVCIAEC